MAYQISTNLYNTIADSYAAINVALAGVTGNAEDALHAIVDVDTTNYPDPENPSLSIPEAALEIELALLQIFNNAYMSAYNLVNSNSMILDAVSAVNDYVISNTSGTSTPAVKLRTWINDTMSGSWTGSYCPDGWANLSREAGYNVVGWETVSEPSGLAE